MVSKTLLANGVSTFFITGNQTCINGPRKMSNPPSWIIVLPVVSFNKIPLFSKYLITFIISFISFFFSVDFEPVIDETFLFSFSLKRISPVFF